MWIDQMRKPTFCDSQSSPVKCDVSHFKFIHLGSGSTRNESSELNESSTDFEIAHML